jgi:protein ImuA
MMWRGSELGSRIEPVLGSGWDTLDKELPGGGWPTRAVTELLTAQPAVLEWRLLGPALRSVTAKGGQVIVVSPPRIPHVPGLLHEGLHESQLVWIKADGPAERLWVTEQAIKSNAAGAVVAWLPQARQEQIRRLQVCAQGCEGLTFLCRPQAARHEASAAPLRVEAAVSLDWQIHVEVFKRRGPAHDGRLTIPSVPGGLSAVLTPRLLKPSALINREAPDVVGRPASIPRQRATA